MEIPTGYAQVNLRFAGVGAPYGAEVTFGVDLNAYASSPTTLATAIGGAALTDLMGHLCSTISLVEVAVKYGPAATGPSGTYSANGAGGDATAQAPINVAALVRKSTALGGRAGRGRFYLPGIPEGKINSNGTLDTTYRTDLETDVDDTFAAIAALGVTPVLLHGADSPISTPTEITALTVDSLVATQRRRLRP